MIEKPVVTAHEAAAKVREGDVVLVGGFLGVGSALSVIHALVDEGTSKLTIACNDSGICDKAGRVVGVGHLVVNHQVAKVITSHIGTNIETQRQMNAGETEVQLVPQGTLAERIRSAGVGLGGILTPTGIGTEVADGKQVITIDGLAYLLELPLKGDVALIKARKADKSGNLVYAATAQNFNPTMAMAARTVIAEVEEIVEIGDIDPNDVRTPGIFVDYLVLATTVED